MQWLLAEGIYSEYVDEWLFFYLNGDLYFTASCEVLFHNFHTLKK